MKDKLMEFAAFFLISILTVALGKAKEAYQKRKKSDVKKIINTDDRITNLLYEVRALLRADRVKLFQIKNGEYFIGGGSEQKAVLYKFALNTGVDVPYHLSNNQIPIGFITETLKKTIEGSRDLVCVSDMKKDYFLRSWLMACGASNFRNFMIVDRKNRPIGFIMATWSDGTILEYLEEDCREDQAEVSIARIGALISEN